MKKAILIGLILWATASFAQQQPCPIVLDTTQQDTTFKLGQPTTFHVNSEVQGDIMCIDNWDPGTALFEITSNDKGIVVHVAVIAFSSPCDIEVAKNSVKLQKLPPNTTKRIIYKTNR